MIWNKTRKNHFTKYHKNLWFFKVFKFNRLRISYLTYGDFRAIDTLIILYTVPSPFIKNSTELNWTYLFKVAAHYIALLSFKKSSNKHFWMDIFLIVLNCTLCVAYQLTVGRWPEIPNLTFFTVKGLFLSLRDFLPSKWKNTFN